MSAIRQTLLLVTCFTALGTSAFTEAPAIAAEAAVDATPLQLAFADTVTITATRNPTSPIDFPGMVNVLGKDDIDAAIPSTIADLVNMLPNVQFVGGPRRSGESPAIRGLGGQDVLVLIDGVRQSWTSGHDGRFFLDPALLRSVEVVRGPASSLYGSGALGGVMAFRTANASDFLSPGQSVGGRVAMGYQGVNHEFLRSVTGFARAGNIDIVGSIGKRTSGDIKLGNDTTLPADDDIVTSFAKAGYKLDDRFSATVIYQGFRNDAVEPADGQGLTIGTPINKRVRSQQVSGEISWKPSEDGAVNLHLNPYHITGKVREIDPATQDSALRSITTDGFSADNRTAFSLADISGLLTVGGEWYRDRQVGEDSTSLTGARSGVPDGKDSFWGMFAQIEARVDRPLGAPGTLTLIPAIRYDAYRTSSDGNPSTRKDSVSPKLAATYAPAPWLFAFGNVGKAFRAPGINELYLSGAHFTVPHPILPNVSVANNFLANPDLKPETSKYWEAGMGLNLGNLLAGGDKLLVKGSYWRQNVNDYINLSVFVPPSFYTVGCFMPPFTANCNVGSTTSVNVNAILHGAELEAMYDSARIRLQLNYGTVSGRERGTAYDLTSLMPNHVTGVATLKVPEINVDLNARIEAAGGFDKSYNPATSDPSAESRKGYTLLDFYASWSPDGSMLNGYLKGLRLDAGVDNVTDRTYEAYQAGVVAPGRNFKMLASYTVGW